MWLTTIHGHVSAVRDNENPGYMRLRFRTPDHAQHFAELFNKENSDPDAEFYTVEETPVADYRWKFSVPVDAWTQVVCDLAEEAATYDNFKGACCRAPMMKGHGGTLHDAWAVWERVQRDEVRLLPIVRDNRPAAERGPGYAKAPAKKASKPAAVKCKNCGRDEGSHRATDKACPMGRAHPSIGYTSFNARQKWEPKGGPVPPLTHDDLSHLF